MKKPIDEITVKDIEEIATFKNADKSIVSLIDAEGLDDVRVEPEIKRIDKALSLYSSTDNRHSRILESLRKIKDFHDMTKVHEENLSTFNENVEKQESVNPFYVQKKREDLQSIIDANIDDRPSVLQEANKRLNGSLNEFPMDMSQNDVIIDHSEYIESMLDKQKRKLAEEGSKRKGPGN